MGSLNGQWKALQKQLGRLEVQTRKVRGEARKRLRRVERQTRVAIRKAIRQAEPRVRRAVDDAARIGRGLRVGLRDDMVGPRTSVVDAPGHVLVPGYIDPHVHPAHVITPSALARHVLPLGTTTVFADTLQFWELGGLRAFRAVADALARSPLKFYWMLRVHGQTRTPDESRRYRPRDLARALAHPSVAAIGEVTRWTEIHAG